MSNLNLELSDDELTELCRLHDKGRSKDVRVPRAMLGRLLRDHSRVIGAAEKRVTLIKAPTATVEDAARKVA